MNTKRALYAVLCLALCLSLNTACNQDQMSKVTINFGEIPLARAEKQPGFIDKLYEFFLPSAHAAWTVNYNSINLTISGDDMDTITAVVPPNSVSFTIEVPMGKTRLFNLFAYDGSVKKWGGHVLADTNKSEVSLSMNVFPIVTNLNTSVVENWVDLEWDRVAGAMGYKIYRASNQLGPFVHVASIDDPGEGPYVNLDNYDPPSPGTYYFRVGVYYTQGEGEPCDPVVAVVLY